jgi:hypothetical protein
VLSLIQRLYEPQSGRVLVDGMPLDTFAALETAGIDGHQNQHGMAASKDGDGGPADGVVSRDHCTEHRHCHAQRLHGGHCGGGQACESWLMVCGD